MQVRWLVIKYVMQILMSVIRQIKYSKIYTKVEETLPKNQRTDTLCFNFWSL